LQHLTCSEQVDSDQDKRENPGSIIGGYKQGSNPAVYENSDDGTAGSGAAQSTAGPHDKDLLNKMDPRVRLLFLSG